MRQPTLSGWMVLGSINGLLPCGLVCAAGAGSAAAGSLGESVAYMAVFGLGRLPMLLGLALSGRALPLRWRTGIQGSVPWTLGLVGVLLIVRGLGLGIPYLSLAVATGCAVIDGLPVPHSARTRYVAIGQDSLARGDVSNPVSTFDVMSAACGEAPACRS